MSVLHAANCVAIAGRAVLIEGPSGSGKSSLALALIDRGAVLIGDDGVRLEGRGSRLHAFPPPNIEGLLEVLRFDAEAPRFVEAADTAEIAGHILPLIRLSPDGPVLAQKAELALERYGLA
jgi:serine kinase of HPr protein (carbohydrate metabolism regulator)